MMTPRERVLAVLRGERPDRVPWFGDLDYWVGAMRSRGTLPADYAGDGYFKLHRDLEVGFYLQGDFPWTETTPGETVEESRVGDRRLATRRNPAGVLHEESTWLPQSCTWAYTRRMVSGPQDIPPLLWHVRHTEVTADYRATQRRRDLVGDNGIVLSYLPRSPFMELVTTLCGLETLVFLLADNPEETRGLLDAMTELADRQAAIALECPAECLMIPENLSSEMIGTAYYREHLRPYEARWISRIRAAGKLSFIHMDGTLRGLLTDVAGTGFDVLEALTPAPSGDMTMADIASTLPARTIAWGGLPGVMFTPLVSESAFERHVRETLEVMTERPRCVLGVADQVPPDGTWERVRKVAALVEKYGALR